MASRIKQDDRKLPTLNFNIDMTLNFPISEIKENADKFAIICANNNITKTNKLKEFFYEVIGVKDENEFNLIMSEQRKQMKDFLRSRMVQTSKSYNFSEIMVKKIRDYIKKEESKYAKRNS